MAEGGAAKLSVELDETHKELEECAICYTEFKDPRFLDCSHRFCLKCLKELKQTQNTKNIVCPICRRETVVSDEGVDMLPEESRGKAGTSQEQHKEGGRLGGLEIICQACDENNEAISRCMECDSFLCGACQKVHQRLGPLRNHKLVTLTELRSENSIQEYEPTNKVPKCEKHPDEDICLYCESCDILICNKCTTFEHKPSIHTHFSIDEAFSKYSKEINDQISQTRQAAERFNSTEPMINHARTRLDKMLKKAKVQISLKAEKEIAKIRQKEEQLKQEAHRIAAQRDKEFALASQSEEILNKVNEIITTASQYEIIQSKTKLLLDLREQVTVRRKFNKSSFLGLKEKEVDVHELGDLVQYERWVCNEIEISTCKEGRVCVHFDNWHSVAVYSTRKMILAGGEKLIISDPEGQVLSFKDYKSRHWIYRKNDPIDIQMPTALIVNKDDQLITLDASGPAVKIFNGEYQLLQQFTPGKESHEPTCLAVDDESNLIAVGHRYKREISLHNPDGSLIRTLSAPMIDKHLTISNQRLIYINESDKKLVAIDYFGKNLFTVTLNGSDRPGGVCCDAAGDIYVVKSKAIQHYRADGRYINEWSCQFCNPSDVTFTPQGTLVVVGDRKVYILQNV